MYLSATGVDLPERVPVAPAIAAGEYDRAEAERTKMVSYTRASDGASALEYAGRAGLAALADTSEDIRAELRALHHTFSSPPGGPLIGNATSKLHELLNLGRNVRPLGMTNGCGMGLLAVEEACLRLGGDPAKRPGSVLLVASEVWPSQIVDPLRSARGLILADGAAAVVVSNMGGFARVLATESLVESSLADATLGADPFAFDPLGWVDLGERFDQFEQYKTPREVYRGVRDDLIREVLTRVLRDAGLTLDDVSAYVLTHSGAGSLRTGYFRLFPPAAKCINTEEIGLSTGHAGTADWFVGLHTLRTQGAIKSGDVVLMFGGAGGWNETAVVLRML